MPDLKSEMSKVLEAWEQDTQQPKDKPVQTTQPKLAATIFKPTNNVTLETFNYVRDNPHATTKDVCAALGAKGLNPNSVGSLLTQFVKQGQMAKDHNNKHIVLTPAYTPLKSTKKFSAEGKRINKIVSIKTKPKAKVTAPNSEGIAALQVDATTQTSFSVTPWTTDGIISKLSVIQARVLYDELKKIFGG